MFPVLEDELGQRDEKHRQFMPAVVDFDWTANGTVTLSPGSALAAAEPEVACWRAHEFVFTSDRDYAAPLA